MGSPRDPQETLRTGEAVGVPRQPPTGPGPGPCACSGMEEEEFICQVNKQYNYTSNRNTLTGCQGRFKTINAGHLWNYTWISNITERVVQGASAVHTVAVHTSSHLRSVYFACYKWTHYITVYNFIVLRTKTQQYETRHKCNYNKKAKC